MSGGEANLEYGKKRGVEVNVRLRNSKSRGRK